VFKSALGDVQLSFPDPIIMRCLGFDTEPGPGSVVISQRAIVPLAFTSIKILLSGISPDGSAWNYTTSPGALLQPTSCMAMFPVDAQPFTWLRYDNTDGSFQQPVADKNITQLRFHLTDWDGQPLTALTRNYMVLKVDTYKRTDPSLGLLATAASSLKVLEHLKLAR
ncbi:MAG: hypothetical protein ACRER5_23000, partial [Pseudomonas sp.]